MQSTKYITDNISNMKFDFYIFKNELNDGVIAEGYFYIDDMLTL